MQLIDAELVNILIFLFGFVALLLILIYTAITSEGEDLAVEEEA